MLKALGWSVIAASLGLVYSCAGSSSPTSLSRADQEAKTQAEMHRSFKTLRAITTALVEGDVPRARNQTRSITRQKFQDAPEDWEEHVEAFSESAYVVSEAGNVEEFATAVGAMATTCAGCHAAIGFKVEVASEPLSKEDRTAGEHMTRYRWAIDRMWEGMSGPSDEIWKRGAEVFANAPADQQVVTDAGDDKIVGGLAQRIQSLGKDAVSTQQADRPAAFGGLLTTCVVCHARTLLQRR